MLDSIISIIERLFAEEDEFLTSRIEKELKKILEALKDRESLSLNKIAIWCDFAAKAFAACVDTNLGAPVLTIAYEGAKATAVTNEHLISLYDDAKMEFSKAIQFRSHQKFPNSSLLPTPEVWNARIENARSAGELPNPDEKV